jgi:hypothetical protein
MGDESPGSRQRRAWVGSQISDKRTRLMGSEECSFCRMLADEGYSEGYRRHLTITPISSIKNLCAGMTCRPGTAIDRVRWNENPTMQTQRPLELVSWLSR